MRFIAGTCGFLNFDIWNWNYEFLFKKLRGQHSKLFTGWILPLKHIFSCYKICQFPNIVLNWYIATNCSANCLNSNLIYFFQLFAFMKIIGKLKWSETWHNKCLCHLYIRSFKLFLSSIKSIWDFEYFVGHFIKKRLFFSKT